MALSVGTNSYISQADADTYFADNIRFAQWNTLDTQTKDRALVTASGQISRFVRETCQLPLTPPINTDLANAAAELGLELTLNAAAISQADTGSNTKRVQAGSVKVEFFRPTSGTRFNVNTTGLLRLAECIPESVSGVAGAFASGTSATSDFTDRCRYDRDEGYA